MQLSNVTKEALQQIKTALVEKVSSLGEETTGKVWQRHRYATDAETWLAIATVVKVSGENALRVCFIYLGNPSGERLANKIVRVTVSASIEVVQQYVDGTDGENSTLAFENFTGDLVDRFLAEDALGFRDEAGLEVINSPLRGEDETDGRPQYVDGVLAHRQIFKTDVSFSRCYV